VWFTLLVRPLSDVLKALRDKGPDSEILPWQPCLEREGERGRERTMFPLAIAYGGTTLYRER
jgi:hypothetical protein